MQQFALSVHRLPLIDCDEDEGPSASVDGPHPF